MNPYQQASKRRRPKHSPASFGRLNARLQMQKDLQRDLEDAVIAAVQRERLLQEATGAARSGLAAKYPALNKDGLR